MSLVEELKKKTVFELKSYAKKNNIDLYGTKTKNEILETIFNFVPLEEFPNVSKEKIEESKKSKIEPKKNIALYSQKNISWQGVGELTKGYNIVSKEASEKWLTHKAVRLATPEEVAKHYGKK